VAGTFTTRVIYNETIEECEEYLQKKSWWTRSFVNHRSLKSFASNILLMRGWRELTIPKGISGVGVDDVCGHLNGDGH